MRVLISTEHRFAKSKQGIIYSLTGGREYSFWTRYLSVFDEVNVLARVRKANTLLDPYTIASGEAVRFVELPDYTGPFEYLQKSVALRKTVKIACRLDSSAILRVPGQISNLLWKQKVNLGGPYALEVVGDPNSAFAAGGIKHPLRRIFRYLFRTQLNNQCLDAQAVAYVTKHSLQKEYAASASAYVTNYSSVELPETAYVHSAKIFPIKKKSWHLIFVGSLAQTYKNPHLLIDVVERCLGSEFKITLNILGEGKYRKELEARSRKKGLEDYIEFQGQVKSGEYVRKHLREADIFVLPSGGAEGLPRAVLEAMASGLPCICTNVGGMPEIITSDNLVEPNDVDAFARKIIEVIKEPGRLTKMSERNLKVAREYHKNILSKRRFEFYKHVREITESWQLIQNQ